MRSRSPALFYFSIYLLLSLLLLSALYYKTHTDKLTYQDELSHELSTHYRAAMETYQILADNFYYEHEEVIAQAMYSVVTGERNADEVRRELYDRFAAYYQTQKLFGLRQLHIHLPLAVSFLRFHLPEKYGDSLFVLRSALRNLNHDFRFRSGYEIGRYFDGFRYIYPLFYAGKFVGSVEWAQSVTSMTGMMNTTFDGNYFFIIDKTLLSQKVSPEYLQRFYPTTNIHPSFNVFKSAEISPGDLVALSEALRDESDITERLYASKTIVKQLEIDGAEHIAILLPVNEIDEKPAGYLVMIKPDTTLHSFDTGFAIQALLVLVLLGGATFHLYRIQSEKLAMRNLLDLQNEMVIMTSGSDMLSANQALLTFFGYDAFDRFREEHRCICDFFLEGEGYLQKRMGQLSWIDYLKIHSDHDHFVKLRSPASGQPEVFLIRMESLPDAKAHIVSFVNVTSLDEEARQLEIKATRDMLTGLYNRTKLNEIFEQERRRCNRYGQPMCLVLFDIDMFKTINDEFGHDLGDRVLNELANFVLYQMRETDMLFRWGGEEFVIVQPNTNVETSVEVCERLRERIAQHRFIEDIHLTCSFGISLYRSPENLDRCFKRADIALYQAKSAGRNRVDVGQ